MTNYQKLLAGVTLLSLPATAVAQSIHPLQRYGDNDVRAGVGLTIPLGSSRRDSSAKPRIELSIQQRRVENRWHSIPNNIDPRSMMRTNRAPETRIGFSLEQQPQIMLNGQALQPVKNQSNIGTAGIVVVGVAALGLALVAFSEGSEEAFEGIIDGATGGN